MKKLLAIGLVLAAAGALAWALRGVAVVETSTLVTNSFSANGTSKRGESRTGATPWDAPLPALSASKTDDAPPRAASQVDEGGPVLLAIQLSEDERALLEMYDEVAAVLDQGGDCDTLATGVRTATEAHAEEVRRLVDAAKTRGAQEAREANERISIVGGEQLAHFRGLFATALETCTSQLVPELQRLSSLRE